MRCSHFVAIAVLASAAGGKEAPPAPNVLPAEATWQLARSLDAATVHARHVWRDTPPTNEDGTVNAFIEIPRGDRRKWEFDMRANTRALDRVIPMEIGGYPVNYGFVPQTISYDGDPFDALVLGPALAGGRIVGGVVVGVMYMEDEKGLDSKVVLSMSARDGTAALRLTQQDRKRIGDYFRRYKRLEPGKFSRVPGWGAVAEGRALIATTHGFFLKCRERAGQPCQIATSN